MADSPGRPERGPERGRPSQGRPERSGSQRSGSAGGGSGRPAPGRPSGPARGGATREEIAQRTYDPRREERRKATRVALPDDVDPRTLDPEARRELRSLSKDTADLVARHLVVTGQLLEEEPERALQHARAARALAGRVAVVREAAGLAAYAAGKWADALSELRAARRISGRPEHLGVMADCERALGRPERALAYADDPQLAELSQDQRVELVIVLAGARRDLDQSDAAVLVLQDPARRTSDKRPWAGRLWYAYADALLAAGRDDQAQEWFAKAAAVDADGETDAGDRLLALQGIVLPEEEDEAESATELPTADELAEMVKGIPSLEFSASHTSRTDQASPDEPSPGRPASAEPSPVVAPAPNTNPNPRSGVAPPPFAAPPTDAMRAEDGDGGSPDRGSASAGDDGDLTLFD